jgi:hypothetical protein
MLIELSDRDYGLDQMLSLLLQHEARLERDEEKEGKKTTTTAFSARGKQFYGKGNQREHDNGRSSKNLSEIECYLCGGKGHRKSVCPSGSKQDQSSKPKEKCKNCGKKGHSEANCWGKKKNGGESVAYTVNDGKILGQAWLLDFGASHHVTVEV